MPNATASPAEGLAAVFLKLARSKGFSTRMQPTGLSQADFMFEFEERIAELLPKLEEAPKAHRDKAQIPLKLGIHPVNRTPPRCAAFLDVKAGAKAKPRGRQEPVSKAELDGLTICFACFFTRMGYKGMHFVQNLNEVRSVVVWALLELEYKLPDDADSSAPEHSLWPRHRSWSCLARVERESAPVISRTEALAKRSA